MVLSRLNVTVFLLMVVMFSGCEQIAQMQETEEPNVVVDEEPAEEPAAMSAVEQAKARMAQEQGTTDPAEPEPATDVPLFEESIHRIAKATTKRGKPGLDFWLETKIKGNDLNSFRYQFEIKDERGETKLVPGKYNAETQSVVFQDFFPGAGVASDYKFRVLYSSPQVKKPMPLNDIWGIVLLEK